MKKKLLMLGTTLFVLICSGCAIKYRDLNGVKAAYNEADYRAMYVINVDPEIPGIIVPKKILCMEPSPDVAKATQSAIQLIANLKGEEALQLSHSKAEAIAALVERTTTIQLLRDQMFRACESYANGAITATSYSLIMSRNNKAMITLMLGETAAGAFGRSGVVIGGKSSSEGSLASEGFGQDLNKALAELKPIDDDIIAAKAEQALNEVNMAKLKEDEANKATEIAELQKKIDQKSKEIDELEAKKANALQLVQSKLNLTTKSAAEILQAQGFGALTRAPSEFAVESLATMQEIYMRDSLADEVISACVVEMGMNTPSLRPSMEGQILRDAINQLKTNASDSQKSIILGSLRRTALTDYCEEHLEDMVTHAEKNRQSNVGRFYELQQAKVKESIISKCFRLSKADEARKCLKWAGMDLPDSSRPKANLRYIQELTDTKEIEKSLATLKTEIANERATLVKNTLAQNATQVITADKIKQNKLDGKDDFKKVIVEVLNQSLENKITQVVTDSMKKKNDEPTIPALTSVQTNADDYITKVAKIYQQNEDSLPDKDRSKLELEYKLIQVELNHFIEQMTDAEKKLEGNKKDLIDLNIKVGELISASTQ